MEMYNWNNNNCSGSVNSQRDQQLLLLRNNNRSPLHSYTNSPYNSPTSDPFTMDSPPLRYSRSSSVNMLGSPGIESSNKYHQILLQNHHTNMSSSSSSSSRGSSVSPLTSIENLETPPSRSPPMFAATPVKVEEDVLVMDGFLVKSSPGGSRTRSSVLDPAVSPTLGIGMGAYKSELCRAWEITKSCPYGYTCLFAHGKEDLRPTPRPSIKNKSELTQVQVTGKTFSSTGPSAYGTTGRFIHHGKGVVAAETSPRTVAERGKNNVILSPARVSVQGIEQQGDAYYIAPTDCYWSPMDDNIAIFREPAPDEHPLMEADKEVLNAHINSILYGPPRKSRLPVFRDIYSK